MLANDTDNAGIDSVYTVMSKDCLEVLARGRWNRHGLFSVAEYEVQLSDGETLYRSSCFEAVQHFIVMLTEPCKVAFPG